MLDRPGRDARPGADGEHGGGRDRRHPRGRPGRRPRDRDGGHQRAVSGADPHRRDRPDEAPHGPSGHDARGRLRARRARPVSEGDRIPLASTEANVQPDQILASLDGDTRNYLKLLVQGGAEGLGGNGEEFSAGLAALRAPRQVRRQAQPRPRRAAAQHQARDLQVRRARDGRLRASDVRLADFVSTQSQVFDAFANQEANLRELLQELPSTLEETRTALASGETLANELGPASEALIPAARAFESGQESAPAPGARDAGADREPDPPVHAEGRARRSSHLEQAADAAGQRPSTRRPGPSRT